VTRSHVGCPEQRPWERQKSMTKEHIIQDVKFDRENFLLAAGHLVHERLFHVS
jgi:hypothetical protein